jgi:ferric-dicitrate binding protein FerR (iron transport regulator)
LTTKENIDELIGKFLSGEASPEEAMLLEDWKEESAGNLQYFEDCKKVFEAAAGIQSPDIDVQSAWEKVSTEAGIGGKVKQLYPKTKYLSIAAMLLLVVGIAFAFLYYFNSTDVTPISYKTANEARSITLADQSAITLAPNSELSFSQAYGKTTRTLRLKGAAYFEVKHNEGIPFIVDAGDVYIKDVGTKFDIRMSKDTDTVYVRVDEGIVLLFDSAGSELTIKASEKAVYVRSTKKIVKAEEAQEVKLPVLNFANAELADVVAALEKEYGIKIRIENMDLYTCRITTQFNKEPIETVLAIITETLGVTYIKTPTGYLIKGNKCNN